MMIMDVFIRHAYRDYLDENRLLSMLFRMKQN